MEMIAATNIAKAHFYKNMTISALLKVKAAVSHILCRIVWSPICYIDGYYTAKVMQYKCAYNTSQLGKEGLIKQTKNTKRGIY